MELTLTDLRVTKLVAIPKFGIIFLCFIIDSKESERASAPNALCCSNKLNIVAATYYLIISIIKYNNKVQVIIPEIGLRI